jgi:hypothetical protein
MLMAAPVSLIRPATALAMPAGGDAMWVWGERVLKPDAELPVFAARHKIGALFVYVSPAAAGDLLSGRREAIEVVRAMSAMGSSVFAVAGEPDWSRGGDDVPAHAALLVRLARTTTLFAGLHFDVEPNALPDWADLRARQTLTAGTLRFYEVLRAAAPQVKIDAAANPIFASLTAGDTRFMRGLAERVSSVSIMAYRNNVSRAVDWAAPAVSQVTAAQRSWRMGVLVGDGEPGTSWQGASAPKFTTAMTELRGRIGEHLASPLYAGLAFQDYDGLSQIYPVH